MRELRVEDALLYLDQVKVEFGDRPHIYNEFLDIMKTFKTHQIDTPGVIRRVSNLFHGNKKLVLGFNTFLPEGYKIELPLDGNGPPVAVFRAPGETITHILSGPGAPPVPEPQKPAAAPPGANFATHGSQGPLRAGPTLGHAAQGLGMRGGPLGQHQAGLGGGAVPGAPAGYAHAPSAALHMQQGAQGARALGQPPQMMTVADQAQQLQGHPSHVASMPGPGRASMFGMGQAQQPSVDAKLPARMGAGAAAAQAPQQRAQPQHQQEEDSQQDQGDGQAQPPGMEFDHAINYVTTIKKRFSNEPETYKKFLEILHTYQKEQRGIKEVLEEVSVLFSEHPDLLKEFTFFLPDAVQSEAKAQLEQAAQEAEERKRLRAQAVAAQQSFGSPQAAQVAVPAVPLQAHSQDHHVPAPPVARPKNPIPFGATCGRSKEREHEIFRSVVYGTISFRPVRPPRKNLPTAAQGAAKTGRPSMLPRAMVQPNTKETDFFEKARKHLNRKELAADRPSATRVRHTPHMEFLKCLHLFGTGVLNKDELMLLLRGLFMQGHAPKSGINVGGGASNPSIANDAHGLLKDLEEILVGRGPYAEQQSNLKCKHKCGSKRTRDYDFGDSEHPTPSYYMLPSDFPKRLFFAHAGQTDEDKDVLNNNLVCVGATTTRGTESPEDYDAIKIRRNVYEEAMFRIEDERFEVDMAIERNALAMRQIEPIAEEVAMLRETEEKDGQPIGRLQYKLKPKSLNSIQINAIGRIYGDKGDEVIEHLARNPLATVPIIYQRLRQKDQEWRKQKSELLSKWRALTEANYEGSRDFMCYPLRREIEKSLSDDRLLEECKKARSFCSSLEKRSGSSINFGLSSPDRSAVLYEPYAVVELKPESTAHRIAVSLLTQQATKNFGETSAVREKMARIWTEFVMPFFDYPVEWVADEARDIIGTQKDDDSTVVKYTTGQHVRTKLGDGVIVAAPDGDTSAGSGYRVKFPFGIGYVRPHSIMHEIESPDGTTLARRAGTTDLEHVTTDEAAVRLDNKFKLLFGTECIYLFIRLFSSLVSLLDDIEICIRDNPTMVDPSTEYYDPMKSSDEKKAPTLDFASVVTKLKNLIDGNLSPKDFESFCRRVAPDDVHKMAALPKLVERGANTLKKVAEEDLLLQLFDHCQFTGANPVELRDKCLAISPDAAFRIQYNTTNGRLYFSYLPENETLSTVVGDDDDDDDDDDDEAMEDGDVESSEDDEDEDDDVMDVEDEEEDLRQVKRSKLK